MDKGEFNAQLFDFLGRSPTPFHAVATMAEQLDGAGFQRLSEEATWQLEPGGKYYVTRNDSAIVAFVNGSEAPPSGGVRVIGAHTDSPCLMVKPSPEVVSNGYFQLGVQVYGGALLNPWFDRDLSLAGRVTYLDSEGAIGSTRVNFLRPIACIPSLAIHLDREANKQRSVNPQQDVVPILCRVDEDEEVDLRTLLRQQIEADQPALAVKEVLDYELSFYDVQPPSLVGLHEEFIASARLDNLLSCFCALQALIEADATQTAMLVCNDHEEVGSQSAVGAQGPFLGSVLRRLAQSEETHAAMIRRSMLISADNAHGVHPNFADRHDENHGPLLNEGPVIKVNASQRYATNSETSALFRLLCARESVPVQAFVVRSDMACGSTIGPITAGVIGMPTLDVGVPTFAMHSVRELAGSDDGWRLCRVLRGFCNYSGSLAPG